MYVGSYRRGFPKRGPNVFDVPLADGFIQMYGPCICKLPYTLNPIGRELFGSRFLDGRTGEAQWAPRPHSLGFGVQGGCKNQIPCIVLVFRSPWGGGVSWDP